MLYQTDPHVTRVLLKHRLTENSSTCPEMPCMKSLRYQENSMAHLYMPQSHDTRWMLNFSVKRRQQIEKTYCAPKIVRILNKRK